MRQMLMLMLMLMFLGGGLASCTTPLAEDGLPYARPQDSMVTDTIALSMLRSDQGPQWFDSRLDRPPAVAAGYQSSVEEVIVTRSYDRQSLSNGRVRDQFHQRTSSESVRRVVR